MKPTIDRTPRYTPSQVICKMKWCPVVSVKAYPAGTHPDVCIIRKDLTAVELITPLGSSWWGFEKAYINSELRMVVSGFDSRNELCRKWEVVRENGRD